MRESSEEWACVEVNDHRVEIVQGAYHCSKRLDIDLSYYSDLDRLAPTEYLDACRTAAAIYAADRGILREDTVDGWTRKIQLKIGVTDSARSEASAILLEQTLSFLTGDYWQISFYESRADLFVFHEKLPDVGGLGSFDAVCLLSGGLDSLIGAIDWLEDNPAGRLLLVGHHDAAGPMQDQNELFSKLSNFYGHRVNLFQPRVGQKPLGPRQSSEHEPRCLEPSCRSRSILFLCLGLLAAGAIGREIPLLVPENGTIGINIPLIAARRGSCSTRTTHPHFVRDFDVWRARFGITNPIINPLALKTKGECLEECRNLALLKQCVPLSVSCGKRGRRQHWTNKQAKSCGYCVPCLFRRAALYKIGSDNENYGIDVFDRSQLSLFTGLKMAEDYTDLLSLLSRHLSTDEVADEIQMNGLMSSDDLVWAQSVVERSLREVHTWISEEGDQLSIQLMNSRLEC